MYDTNIAAGDGPAFSAVSGGLGSALSQLMLAQEIEPGSPPGYELCKTIHAYHPLGAILTDAPVTRAQAKPRDINIPMLGEERIVEQFNKTWKDLGRIGGTIILHNLLKTSRIYGIASLAVGERGKDPATPLDPNAIVDSDLFFNILDPLNTAGSLVLDQDPNSPGYLKPSGSVAVNGQVWHPSRLYVKMHEQPLYIEWTSSAFGFVGRSIYQRALYPLKTFLQTMITDQMVTQKAGLLIAKMKSPSSLIDNVMAGSFAWKRSKLKSGSTGQVLSIGVDEDVATLNMQNLADAAAFARTNVLKNIASAAGMPASIIAQETLTEGFGEGTEDAKKEYEYLEYIREDMSPAYDFLDRIVMRKAWTRDFYEALCSDYPELKSMGYEQWFYRCADGFEASWPNLLAEPDSKKSEREKVQFEAVVALAETMLPVLDPVNRASFVAWMTENVNERKELFSGGLVIDQDALQEHLESQAQTPLADPGEEEKEPREPRPFSSAS